jgi:hypothetical protein
MPGREQARETTNGVSIARRWAEYLVAVLSGNIAYLFVEPELPTIMRHRMFRVDFGLAVDFLICVAAYVLVRAARAWSSTEG